MLAVTGRRGGSAKSRVHSCGLRSFVALVALVALVAPVDDFTTTGPSSGPGSRASAPSLASPAVGARRSPRGRARTSCDIVPLPDPLGFCDHQPTADGRDRSALRTLVGEVVAGLGSLAHRELDPAFEHLGMPGFRASTAPAARTHRGLCPPWARSATRRKRAAPPGVPGHRGAHRHLVRRAAPLHRQIGKQSKYPRCQAATWNPSLMYPGKDRKKEVL